MYEKKKTIGLLIDFFTECYQAEILHGVTTEAAKQGVNLFCFTGGELNSPKLHHAHRNDLYDLPDSTNIEGLIILGATIGNYVDNREIEEFILKFNPIPMVSIGTDMHIKNIPNIMIDNASGMRALIEHLIREHGYKDIAFICGTEGNPEAQSRFSVYKELLEQYGIPYNPDLVTPGNFYAGAGKEAVALLLDERKVKFDALVGSSDLMAIEALKELQHRGIRIPYDLAVVGFDDIEESNFNKPPLTTVKQPLRLMGALAVQTLLAKMAGEKIKEQISLTAQLQVRRSCGCMMQKKRRYISLFSGNEPGQSSLAASLQKKDVYARITKKIADAIRVLHKETQYNAWAVDLLHSIIDDIENANAYNFLSTFDRIISLAPNADIEFTSWEYVVSTIVNEIRPFITSQQDIKFLNNLANNAFDIIKENEREQQFTLVQQSNEKSRKLHIISMELINTFNINKLGEVIINELPGLGIKECYIMEYISSRKPIQKARCLAAYNEEGVPLPVQEEREFDVKEIIPHSLRQDGKIFSYIIMALYFKDEPLGYVVFDNAPLEGVVYERLTIQISGTLKGAKLIKTVQQHAQEMEMKTSLLENQKKVLNNQLQQSSEAMSAFIKTLITTVEVRDPYTAGHLRRVADLASRIAIEMKLPQEKIETIRIAASIHDLGKIYVPAEILNRPGPISTLERDLIKTHPHVAFSILKNISFPWPIAEAIYQHHEYYDGTGYPRQLKKDEILLEARIICVADVVEAIASHRPYRGALGIEKALSEIETNSGILFDPEVVSACLELFREKGYELK